MNEVILRGIIRDIDFSHDIGNVEYGKANLVCKGENGREDDIISLRFKRFSNRYNNGDYIELKGNLRSYSQKDVDGNKVLIYVFTYFDIPPIQDSNYVNIDGNICKMGKLSTSKYGKKYIHFTLANNIFTPNNKKLNNYIPCTAYGEIAENIVANYDVKDRLHIKGVLHSHTYKKYLEDDTIEYRIAHEVVIQEYE